MRQRSQHCHASRYPDDCQSTAIFAWLDTVFCQTTKLMVFARADDYFFRYPAIRIHEVWALKQGTRLENESTALHPDNLL